MPLPPLDESSALDLFVDRMVVTTPAFDVEHDRGSLEQLCHRLDGFPLALELAAARCRTLTPAQLLVRLERRPELLHDAAGLFDERHRDLDRLIAWSLEELSPSARCVLNRLTVVIGSFNLETGEAVAAGDGTDEFDVIDALEELVDAGLVVEEQGDDELRHRCSNRSASTWPTDSPKASASRRRERHGVGSPSLLGRVSAGSVGPSFGYLGRSCGTRPRQLPPGSPVGNREGRHRTGGRHRRRSRRSRR